MTSLAPLRCTGLRQAVLSDDGSAVLLELAMANGQLFPLELDGDGVELLTRALLACAQALGERQRDRPPLSETVVSQAVQLPVQGLESIPTADGKHAALVVRAGSLDIALQFDDAPATRAAMRAALQAQQRDVA